MMTRVISSVPHRTPCLASDSTAWGFWLAFTSLSSSFGGDALNCGDPGVGSDGCGAGEGEWGEEEKNNGDVIYFLYV